MPDTMLRDRCEPVSEIPTQPLRIDFLYWEECPSHEGALQLLQGVLHEEGVNADIVMHEVDTYEEAERMRFPGSPTIRVAGSDIIDDPNLPVGLTCRTYYRPDGRMTPMPPRDAIVQAVRRAVRGETTNRTREETA